MLIEILIFSNLLVAFAGARTTEVLYTMIEVIDQASWLSSYPKTLPNIKWVSLKAILKFFE